jgi:hypothetical protein
VLDYILGPDGTRHGSQIQEQITNGNQVCWVKYADANQFECWR